MKTTLPHMERLLEVMQILRDPNNGCPWDIKQTMDSLVKHTLEEAYEVADAIHRGDITEIRDELGDLLFQIVFYAQIANEQGTFDFDEVAKAISAKLIRRHPHVFEHPGKSLSDAELALQWQSIKAAEKAEVQSQKGAIKPSITDDLARGTSALQRAEALQRACAKVGFDWPDVKGVLAKVREEVDEVAEELHSHAIDREAVEEEIGDLLFAVVNLTRHLDISPEIALQKANIKFERRFRHVEHWVADTNRDWSSFDLAELEAFWQRAKRQN
ncbi:nucleoside triphosphate pyrophosphohydrolase [Alteromonas sp. ASW11-36]|uniref:Nucleoside triphosphate pyrophosphohydrolase n=1 Tax=Alteromonas arenosi TaxID=3055817 RepID=A0ABT7T054_9ALTE|nr:nucleoside triphosphate pyrophosphohydrolase [Alteromonas sp. ASW11-36]MDM7861823.1 nucleoside triphosphate pyrophosphohydrolase [Alteromonas sp. ASW11-36]